MPKVVWWVHTLNDQPDGSISVARTNNPRTFFETTSHDGRPRFEKAVDGSSSVPDASSCIGNRRLRSHEILSEIDANDDKHHSTILDEPSNDVHAVGRLIEIS